MTDGGDIAKNMDAPLLGGDRQRAFAILVGRIDQQHLIGELCA
jgi:hypothetical protein